MAPWPLLGLAALVVACGAAQPQVDPGAWETVGALRWRAGNGAAEAGPATDGSFLVSPALYGDFDLTVEFWIDGETNSGVFIRCGAVNALDDLSPFNCYEVNIFDRHPRQEHRTGAIVLEAEPVARVDTVGRWNTLDIRARGNCISVTVNGTHTATIEDARVAPGQIALQYGGTGLVRFRHLRIRENRATAGLPGD